MLSCCPTHPSFLPHWQFLCAVRVKFHVFHAGCRTLASSLPIIHIPWIKFTSDNQILSVSCGSFWGWWSWGLIPYWPASPLDIELDNHNLYIGLELSGIVYMLIFFGEKNLPICIVISQNFNPKGKIYLFTKMRKSETLKSFCKSVKAFFMQHLIKMFLLNE